MRSGTFIPHASSSPQTGGGADGYPIAPFARPGICTRASHQKSNRVEGREEAKGVGGGNGDGDGDGAGTITGVEANEGKKDGSGDGAGMETRGRAYDGNGTGGGTETRTKAEMGTGRKRGRNREG